MPKTINKRDDLTPDPNNANRGTVRGRKMVEDSLKKYGAGRSIVTDVNGVVLAGNKTLEAAEDLDLPIRVIPTDGRELVVVQRTDLNLETDPRARELAYIDNRASQVGLEWDPAQLDADLKAGVDLSVGWDESELAVALRSLASVAGQALQLLDVTVREPRHQTNIGDVWILGDRHILVVESLITGWPTWQQFLTDEVWFAPYPGLYLALGEAAAEHNLLMVQPDTFIAGHTLDAYEDVHGEKSVTRRH